MAKQSLQLAVSLLHCFLGALACIALTACSPPPKKASQTDRISADRAAALVAARIAEHAGSDRPVRLAVVAFAPTRKHYGERNDFGVFFAEKTIGALASTRAAVRLYERSLLEKIARENALQLSGAMDTREATRLGELAPIDWILTGTYTLFDTHVAVDARLLQVVSGEILAAIGTHVTLSPDIAALFPEAPRPGGREPLETLPEEPCADVRRVVDSLSRDVSTAGKARALTTAAMQAPLDTACAAIHIDIMRLLRRGRHFPQAYVAFLLDTLRGLAAPTRDERAERILHYLHAAGPYDDTVFDACMQVVRKAPAIRYLRYLFHTDGIDAARMATQKRRVDRFLDLARRGKLGLPTVVPFPRAFGALISVFSGYPNAAEVALLLHCYQKGLGELDGDRAKRHHGVLGSMYSRARDSAQARAILRCICDNFNAAAPSSKIGWAMLGFVKELTRTTADPERGSLYRGHAELFAESCEEQFSRAAEAMKLRGSGRRSAVLHCLEAGVLVRGIVPTVDSLVADLSSGDDNARYEAALFLAAMGPRAAPAEPKAVDLLFKAEYKGATASMLTRLCAILGHTRSRNPKGHRSLVKLLSHTGHGVARSAAGALTAIGPPAIPSMKKAFPDARNAVKIRIVKALAAMGPSAVGQIPFLRSQLAAADNAYLRDALEDALASLERSAR